jgi:hypothetical protein
MAGQQNPSLGLEKGDEIAEHDISLVFRALFRSELTFV